MTTIEFARWLMDHRPSKGPITIAYVAGAVVLDHCGERVTAAAPENEYDAMLECLFAASHYYATRVESR